MEVFTASDGYVLKLPKLLSDYQSVDELTRTIAPQVGVPGENVLLFLADGREVNDRLLSETHDRGGSGQGSEPKKDILYLFNRETFWTEPGIWAEKCKEELVLPPLIDPETLHDLSTAQEPFLMAQDQINHILSLFTAQHLALSIAYQNLEQHLAPLREEWNSLFRTGDERLKEQADLLESAPNDLALLPRVTIHPVFWLKRDATGNVITRGKDEVKEKTMADYIHSRKMEEVLETCRASHLETEKKFNEVADQMEDLLQMAEMERTRAEQTASAIRAEFEQAMHRLDDAIEAIADAVDEDHFVDLALELEDNMRNDLAHLTALKNDYTLDVHVHLSQVAAMESRIAQSVKPLTSLETDFKSKGAFPHLSRLRKLPLAYVSLVLEYRWRIQFGDRFSRWCKRLNEAIGSMLLPERQRRLALNKDLLSFNPFTVLGMEESAEPYCDFTIFSGAEALEKIQVDDEMLADLDQWIMGLVDQIEGTTPPGPARDTLAMHVQQLIDDYERTRRYLASLSLAADETQWNKQVIASIRNLKASEHLDTSVEEGHPPSIPDLETRDEKDLRHREEVEIMDRRQAELQDEIDRLRTQLGEEVLARQTISAELDERNRLSEDRLRDQEEQSDLVNALQVDMAQEKDRATDLGVRLQEALLDVDGLKNAEQTLLAQLQQLQDERSRHFQSASDAQADADELRSHVAGVQAELDALSTQLVLVQQERDTALRNQSAEAERLMRDRIAEADGDRAVLEHQNVTLNKEVEDLKRDLGEKLTAARNTAIRQADGLKAELALSKAQLREAQRREAVLSDEMAMLKDSANALTSDRGHQAEVARDAVALVTKYYETCRPLLKTLNTAAASKRTGSDEAEKEKYKPRSTSPVSVAHSTTSMRESVLVRSLASAQNFDLEALTDAVSKVITRTKRYQKGYKLMREVSRSKISYTDFQRGDVALFLPTRDPSRRLWAAFNVNAPHHFLKADENMKEEAKSRDWIMARITSTEESVAGETSESNPLALTAGLRYHIHETEPFDPSLRPRTSRRSTSMGLNSMLLQDGPASPTQPLAGPSRPSMYTSASERQSSITISGLPTSLRETVPLSMSPGAASQRSEGYFPPILAAPAFAKLPTSTIDAADRPTEDVPTVPPPMNATSAIEETLPPKLSPVDERPIPPRLSPRDIPGAVRPPSRTSHYRSSSRSTLSPTLREMPLFAPSSLGRPASVASSHSTHSRGIPIGGPGGKAAPAMAITSSQGSGTGNFSPGSHGLGMAMARPPSGSSFTASASRRGSESGGSALAISTGMKGSPLGVASGSNLSVGTGSVSGTSGIGSMARTISRGFSINKTRTTSGASSAGSASGTSGKGQTAAEILKQYGDKK